MTHAPERLNHGASKRKRPRNRRGGCKLCKFWKVNGYQTEREDGEKFSDHRRHMVTDEVIAAALLHTRF